MQNEKATTRPEQGPCAYCGKSATLVCTGGCGETFYCSKEHQSSNWKAHRSVCKFYKCIPAYETQEPLKKSYLVASRKIPKGKIIMRSKAIVIGPSGSKPVCLGCLRPIFYDVLSYQCEGCGWPVCNMECQQAEMHKLECKAMQQAGFRLENEQLHGNWHETFQSAPGLWVLVLRLLLSNKASELFKFFRKDDHETKLPFRKYLDHVSTQQGCYYITEYLRQKQFQPEQIAFVKRVLMDSLQPVEALHDQNNIFEQRHACGIHASDIVYLRHSCLPNLNSIATVDDPTVIKVISLKEIQRGEILTVFKNPATTIFEPTMQRQASLVLQVTGLCACLRCRSPSELSLHSGSQKCKSCRGMVVPLSTANIMMTDWACEKCGLKVNVFEILTSYAMLNVELDQLCNQKDDLFCQNLVKFIETHSGPSGALHQHHSFIILAKDRFCDAIFTQSFEQGASYQFSPQVLSKFYSYSSNVENYFRSLHIDLSVAYLRRVLVKSRSVIHKWIQREISQINAKAQVKIIHKELLMKLKLTPIRSMEIELRFRNAIYELIMHFNRLNVPSGEGS